MPGVFLRRGDELVAMEEREYEEEAVLQELLEPHPALLAGDASTGSGSEWLLIRREASVALGGGRGPRGMLDHLFVDATGVPTLVEVKRSSDGRIRREVVGQMLDYAANASAQWADDALKRMFEERCSEAGEDPDQALREALGNVEDLDRFWATVRSNLAGQRLRLVFVADEIPAELRRIVEYLNGEMRQTEVLAIEVKQYRDASGEHETFVPRLVGDTEAARQAKGSAAAPRWDRDSVSRLLEERCGARAADAGRRLFAWVDARGDLRDFFGSGSKDGSYQAGYWDKARYLWPFVLYTYGKVEIQFQPLSRRPPFDAPELRRELHDRLSAVPGVALPPVDEAKRPSIDLELLASPDAFAAFTETMDWAFAQAGVYQTN